MILGFGMELEVGESLELEDQQRFGMKLEDGESMELEDQLGQLHKWPTMKSVTEPAIMDESVTGQGRAHFDSYSELFICFYF